MRTRKKDLSLLLVTVLSVTLFTSCLKSDEDVPPPPGPGAGTTTYKWLAIADSAQASLNLFWSPAGKYFTSTNSASSWTQYWPSAHGLDVLVDLYLRNPSASLKSRMDEVTAGIKAMNSNSYINFYYDDMEWMALACLRAFNATGDDAYKDITLLLWNDIKNGWSADLGGGIWWRKDNPSKNAPSNLPAAILAARLYKKFNNADDLAWAKKIYDWQKSTLYDASTGWVYDNIEKNGTKNQVWKFTYNQGTFIGAALELFSITNANGYQADAIKAAEFAISSGQLTDISTGVLRNEGGGDGGLFKGVLVRYLTRFIIEGQLTPAVKTQYINFLKSNAEKLWSKGTNKNYVLFGSDWVTAPGNTTDFTVQLSGIMLFEALAELKDLALVE
ncbi:MAG: glycosyl hydrolase family 76 [Chitinophagaceae bacterium]|nr:glycosyl hydrolase family 76 [Chitinophagaceae bacterium]